MPPPQLPPNYRPYKEHFPMITEVNDLAKANKLSISQVSKSSAPAPVPEDSLEAGMQSSLIIFYRDSNFFIYF